MDAIVSIKSEPNTPKSSVSFLFDNNPENNHVTITETDRSHGDSSEQGGETPDSTELGKKRKTNLKSTEPKRAKNDGAVVIETSKTSSIQFTDVHVKPEQYLNDNAVVVCNIKGASNATHFTPFTLSTSSFCGVFAGLEKVGKFTTDLPDMTASRTLELIGKQRDKISITPTGVIVATTPAGEKVVLPRVTIIASKHGDEYAVKQVFVPVMDGGRLVSSTRYDFAEDSGDIVSFTTTFAK